MSNDDDDDRPAPDWHAPELEAAREEIQRGLQHYADELARQRGDEPYIVTGWVLGFEGTNVELEQSDRAAREAIVPVSQSLSTAAGLAAWMAGRWI